MRQQFKLTHESRIIYAYNVATKPVKKNKRQLNQQEYEFKNISFHVYEIEMN